MNLELSRESPEVEGRLDLDYRAVFDSVPDGIVITDEEGLIVDVNPCALRQFGYERDELVGQTVEVLVPETYRRDHVAHRADYTDEPVVRPMASDLELVGRRKDGTRFPVEISLSPWPTSDRRLVIGVVRDITERLRLRAFGQEALRAAEEERQRISRELHDDTAQRLAALMIQVRLASRETDDERRQALLDELREALLETSESVRRFARGLRPPALEDAGLVAALQAHIRDLFENLDVTSSFDAGAVDHLLDADAKLVLYRVVQEALSNVVRHANAESVRVVLSAANGAVVAVVEDDGVGFDERRVDDGGGLGLIGMQERTTSVGGRLKVESVPGEGTLVRLEIPQSTEKR